MAEMMRALSLKRGELGLRSIPRPVPGPGQILVRTLACAICASDHHYMDHPEVSAADRSGMRVDAPNHDVVMGHEFCGEIVDYGPDTQRRWPVGARITAVPALVGVTGLRIIGMAPDAPGAFGEYFLVSEGFAKHVPESIPPEQIALTDAMAVGWYYTRLGSAPNAVPLVIGLGAIGLSVVAALKHRGAATIVAADFDPARRELARRLGATALVDPRVADTFAEWRRAAWGNAAEVHDRIELAGKADCVVFESSGATDVLAGVIDHCPIGTRIFSAGGTDSDTIPTETAHIKGISIQFGGGPGPDDWFEMCDLVASREIDTSPLIGETVGFDGLQAAFERSQRPGAPPRIVFKPDGTGGST
ncbi:MAG: zinc-binding dehydrogenase [Gordonia sp. (in: high G+C Gram-positive bacteria)]|uniref:zinc-binding dehydrogenase n=1 Tax=Gordonia sp. (in: high G+C Gram-positive bacteria) TaxID=84139 RepID=UPI0039E62F57